MSGIPAFAAVAGAAVLVGVAVGVRARARALRDRRRDLWPDLVDHLVALLRSGSSVSGAVVALADSGPAPLRPQLAAYRADMRVSADPVTSLRRLKASLADPVADRILETLVMAHTVGGTDTVAVLRGLAAFVRDDAALRHEVRARQSWVKSAAVLGAVAPWAVLAMLATRPETAAAYATPLGAAVILGGALVSGLAYALMTFVGRIPDDRRWFA